MKFEFVCKVLLLIQSMARVSFTISAISNDLTYNRVSESQKMSAIMQGDFMIAALVPVHQTPYYNSVTPLICNIINEQYGIQRVEAALYVIDKINRSPDILPNITLGIDIKDSCWSSPALALHQSLRFVQKYSCLGRLSNDLCPRNMSQIVGVIGPASSEAAMQVQNLLQLFQISQVGYASTSSTLSDKSKYGYFVRVVPSDSHQAVVMIQILKQFNWSYVFAVHTEGEYGRTGINKFLSLVPENDICIADEVVILDNSDDKQLDKIMTSLYQNEKAKVVVCFCEGYTINRLLNSAKRLNKVNDLIFIGSDAWAGRYDIIKGVQDAAQGNIMIKLHSSYVHEFDSYYLNLKHNQRRNPWFQEFWEARFNCTFDGRVSGQRRCTGKEDLKKNYSQDPKLSFIFKSIYALAYALDNYSRSVTDLEDLYPMDGLQFLHHLRNVTFSYKNETVKFDEHGDPLASYDIYNYRQFGNNSYAYIRVGNWSNGSLQINASNVQFPGNVKTITSTCSEPCSPGYEKFPHNTRNLNKTCCWTCLKCGYKEVSNGETCKPCPKGYKPNPRKTECVQMEIEYIRWSDTTGLVCTTFSCIGVVLTCLTIITFFKFSDTPVVKSSTKELCYIMFTAMLVTHCSTFLIIGQPTSSTCTLVRIVPGVGLCGIYSALLVKTNRISRIMSLSKKRFPKLKPRLISTKAQICTCCGLILIEVTICFLYIQVYPVTLELSIWQGTHKNVTFDRTILECYSSSVTQELVFPFLFNAVLLIFCTLYAFKTRHLPINFRESKCIGFACYATIITWVAFVSIYLGSVFQTLSFCVTLSMSALITLVCLFLPKLYIIYWQPEKNTRAFFKTTKALRCHIGSVYVANSYEQMNEMIKSDILSTISTAKPEVQQIFAKLQEQYLNKQNGVDRPYREKNESLSVRNKACQTSSIDDVNKVCDELSLNNGEETTNL